MPRPLVAACAAAALLAAPSALAQAPASPKPPISTPNPMKDAAERTRSALQLAPAPRPEDVRSIDSLIAALYDVISGPAGQARDWQRFRSLFHPGAQMIPIRRPKDGKGPAATPFTPDDYATSASVAFAKRGFFEKETRRQVSGYGDLVQVLSAYETREAADGPVMATGVNSLQLVFDGRRWWILNIAWTDDKAAGVPVPKDFTRK
ncbi:nuclear transport factor 2 family protein [Myxococcus sp. SDU36]|uniref:nuclear transport factor 2 family protein n=1 Tax=Myxococcus sp. SDU36 TaxID=2831967 RepID=UPI0025434678|nr:nuclear transport factor 2 family protein [Myxococcus sp. SDU36]WIG94798.1 nuclear transport factor 2 family protein [Myxococcus sp. SDU36]